MKIQGLRETDYVPVSFTDEEKKVLYLATLQIAMEGNFVQIDRQQVADKMGYGNKASANTAIWTLRHNIVRKAGMSPGGQAPDVTIDDDGRIIIRVHDSAHPAPANAGKSATNHSSPKVNSEPSPTPNLRQRKVESELDEEIASSLRTFLRSTKSRAIPSAKHQNDKKPTVEESKQSRKTKGARTARTPANSPERASLVQAQKSMGEALTAFLAKEAAAGEHYDMT